jgi:hypothetical protein
LAAASSKPTPSGIRVEQESIAKEIVAMSADILIMR